MVDRPELRKFITQFFSDLELEELCFDYFPDLRDEFTLGMNKSQKVIALIDYAERRGMTNHLLTALDQSRPAAYRERFPPVAPPENRSKVVTPLTTAPSGGGKLPAGRHMPVWGWLVGVGALVALVVWAGMAFRGRGGDGQEPEATMTVVAGVATEQATVTGGLSTTTVTPATTSTQRPTTVLVVAPITATTPAVTPATTSTQRPTATPTSLPTPTSAPTREPQAGDIRVVTRGGVEVEQVYVPAGSFMMGSEDGNPNERPVHEVALDAFWIDRTEVTNAQYAACVADGACNPSHHFSSRTRDGYYDDPAYADYPVIWVSWEDATAFAAWSGGRLPTEAEWEYAARGPESFVYPWGNQAITCDLANYWGKDGGCVGDTSKVGDYPDGASWVGALDMAGNVWEWVNDWYAADYYGRSSSENPVGPDSGQLKALRGGSWNIFDQYTRAACRYFDLPHDRVDYVGFRVAEFLSDPDS